MACVMDFGKLRLGEHTAPSSLCLRQLVSHCLHNRISVNSGKDLNFVTNYVFLVTKYDRNYKWQDFHRIYKRS